ncbi:hypothetical protein EVAR_43886_1 [Eumeta japonica]|uniref:Uncharacterized protein n=1 Tax=Eumeta variegata TaxID=151549 RepID=A0A4C1WRD4_EUMVA|nr:hypothetical protein EVAR_43886_1 [Eumeta japonica]
MVQCVVTLRPALTVWVRFRHKTYISLTKNQYGAVRVSEDVYHHRNVYITNQRKNGLGNSRPTLQRASGDAVTRMKKQHRRRRF